MATGYTYPVKDGEITDVKDFAAICARAFGAFIHQRDDNKPGLRYPDPPSDYYFEHTAEAQAKRREWDSLTEEEKYVRWSAYAEKQQVELHQAKAKAATEHARYQAMLAQVHAISVPSQLQNFKDFMVSQLEDSIRWDGSGTFEDKYYRVLDYIEWCEAEEESVQRNVAYYSEQREKEKDRYREQIEYINLMRDTFGFEVEK